MSIGSPAAREESTRHNLGSLPTSGMVVQPEVRPVAVSAGFPCRTAGIAADHTAIGKPLHIIVECRPLCHILEHPDARRFAESCGVGYDLGYLTASGAAARPEIGQVTGRYTRFSRAAARIPAHIASRSQPPDIIEESTARKHILELLSSCRVVQPCGVGYDLGKLSSGHVAAGFKRTIRIAADNPSADEAAYEVKKGTALRHVDELYRTRCWCGQCAGRGGRGSLDARRNGGCWCAGMDGCDC